MHNAHTPVFHDFSLRPVQIRLEDGSVFPGMGICSESSTCAEFVFNTATTGFEEVLTDPSYGGQVVVFTTPHLGTTGWTEVESEFSNPTISGVVCRKISNHFDNHLAQKSLVQKLQEESIPYVTGVDTRALALKLRENGTMIGRIEACEKSQQEIPIHSDTIFPKAAYPLGGSFFALMPQTFEHKHKVNTQEATKKIAVIDFGVKRSILAELEKRGAIPFLVPWNEVSYQGLKDLNPDGVLFSNGPGDPRILLEMQTLLGEYKTISEKFVSFGICFGHQALALAHGAQIVKLQFGHHALNHPVVCVDSKGQFSAVYITSQNHNYAVDPSTFPTNFNITFNHLNDGTIAGLEHKRLPLFSVQFHPEAGPGPRETGFLFDTFLEKVRSHSCC